MLDVCGIIQANEQDWIGCTGCRTKSYDESQVTGKIFLDIIETTDRRIKVDKYVGTNEKS
jgi:hypothetical protein